MSGPGRRSGSPDTRNEILTAARTVFSERGYDRATVRGIASVAGVDPALIHHYFGTKANLFAASIHLPLPPGEMVASAIGGESDDPARLLVELFLSVWETEQSRASLLGILRSATTGETSAVEAFREFMSHQLADIVGPMVKGEDSALRTELIASHLVGVAITRYVVKIEPIASAPRDKVIDLLAPRIDSYLRP